MDTLLVGGTEHVSVLSGGRFPPERVRQIPVDATGTVRLSDLAGLLAEGTAGGGRVLVAVMLANNETGVIQPVAEIARLARAAGAMIFCDAIQAAGRIPVDIAGLGVDALTLSAHKIGGPQGAGAIVRAGSDLAFAPLLTGGGQERRLRAGTENIAATAGFGAVAEAAHADLAKAQVWAAWRDELAAIMTSGGLKAVIFGDGARRLPQTLCIAIEGIPAETLLIALDLAGIAVSSGSACSSGKVAASHVLAAMGVPSGLAKSTIRLSLGWESQESDLHLFASAWRRVLKHVAPKHQAA